MAKLKDLDAMVGTAVTDIASQDVGPVYSFLAVYNQGTLRFDAPVEDADNIVTQVRNLAEDGKLPGDARAAMRTIVRDGFLDNHHLDAARSQPMVDAVIWLCLTCDALKQAPDSRGFILEITSKGGADFNFRYMVALDREAVDTMTNSLRKDRNYIVSHSPKDIAKAVARKRTPPPRDPSLEAPSKPRPERWMAALEEQERAMGKSQFAQVRACLSEGAMFVWRSRQIEDAAQEEINASLGAMAEFGRLKLPFPAIWAETRDWLEVPQNDGPLQRLPARFGIAAVQSGDLITFWGFADCQGRIQMSVLRAEVDSNALIDGRRHFTLDRPSLPGSGRWDESEHRRISQACGDRLLELIFLLSTSGVARDVVREGGKPGHRQKGQRRASPRNYTVVRVPLNYVPGGLSEAGEGGETGRWVRPHVRRAHILCSRQRVHLWG